MSSSARGEFPRKAVGSDDPERRLTGQRRGTVDNIRLQSDAANDFADDYPDVVELEAMALDAGRREMKGESKALAPEGMDEGNFRAWHRGERSPMTLREICRLRLSPQPAARRVSDAVLTVVVNAGGSGEDISLDKTMALLELTAGCVAGLARDLNDGVITREEAGARLPQARILQARICALVTSLEVAERMPEKGGAR